MGYIKTQHHLTGPRYHNLNKNIYNTIVKSSITYGSETWHLKSGTIHKLHSTQMDFWRRSTRISKRDNIRKPMIREKMKVKGSLTEDIKTAQLRWFGHVKRMREDRLPKKIFNGSRWEEERTTEYNLD
ncbi:hypothetical protein C0J52_22582 [Blattella germanica]|nr:hypothetical protein C0J52_22582 [Blattella germanica]PSN37815.1 hypothetical protein C0J52_22582 [Blattella germanica]PSN37816.1 hypothetical protein C0J52_22582 [Blattella germanica]